MAQGYNLADHTSFADVHGEVGVTVNAGGVSLKVLIVDDSGNIRQAVGATVPTSGNPGFATGCEFIYSPGGPGATEYMNIGSSTSCLFMPQSNPQQGNTLVVLSTQNIVFTGGNLISGVIEHASVTGAGTATFPTGTQLSAAFSSVNVGNALEVMYINTGTQTVTLTAATGITIKGNVTVASGKAAQLYILNTGTNAWTVYSTVSA